MQLDSFDHAILGALYSDARLTNQQLSERVNLSPSQCSRRRARLELDGVIKGYGARIDLARLGFGIEVLVNVSLSSHSKDNARNFKVLVNESEKIRECYTLSGEADYQLKVVVPNLEALAHFLSDELLGHDSVQQVRSSVVLERVKDDAPLPIASADY